MVQMWAAQHRIQNSKLNFDGANQWTKQMFTIVTKLTKHSHQMCFVVFANGKFNQMMKI